MPVDVRAAYTITVEATGSDPASLYAEVERAVLSALRGPTGPLPVVKIRVPASLFETFVPLIGRLSDRIEADPTANEPREIALEEVGEPEVESAVTADEGPLVFLSYATSDRFLALEVEHFLEQHGARVWVDSRRLEPADELDRRITDAIQECDLFIVLWSDAASRSAWVQMERACARDSGRRILPVMLDGTEPPTASQGIKYLEPFAVHGDRDHFVRLGQACGAGQVEEGALNDIVRVAELSRHDVCVAGMTGEIPKTVEALRRGTVPLMRGWGADERLIGQSWSAEEPLVQPPITLEDASVGERLSACPVVLVACLYGRWSDQELLAARVLAHRSFRGAFQWYADHGWAMLAVGCGKLGEQDPDFIIESVARMMALLFRLTALSKGWRYPHLATLTRHKPHSPSAPTRIRELCDCDRGSMVPRVVDNGLSQLIHGRPSGFAKWHQVRSAHPRGRIVDVLRGNYGQALSKFGSEKALSDEVLRLDACSR